MMEGDVYKGGNSMQASTLFSEPTPATSAQWINRGHRLQHEGQYADAFSAYEQAILCNPQDASNYEYMADAFKKLKMDEFALAAYQRALDLNPNSLDLYIY